MFDALVRLLGRMRGLRTDRLRTPQSGAAHGSKAFSVSDIFPSLPQIKIVDAGAMWLGPGSDLHARIVDLGLAQVVGFEPIESECKKLNEISSSAHAYYPFVLGDGSPGHFRVCNSSMTSSLYEPNPRVLQCFPDLEDQVRVVREIPVTTRKLDDITEAAGAHYLKLDVQGAELDILRGAVRFLETILVVHTEVEFVPLYRGQPLFAEVDRALRDAGFSLFTFTGIQSRAFHPFSRNRAALLKAKQALWTDAVYVKSLFSMEELDKDCLMRMFVILHFVYEAFDLCLHLLTYLDRLNGSETAKLYGDRAAAWLKPL